MALCIGDGRRPESHPGTTCAISHRLSVIRVYRSEVGVLSSIGFVLTRKDILYSFYFCACLLVRIGDGCSIGDPEPPSPKSIPGQLARSSFAPSRQQLSVARVYKRGAFLQELRLIFFSLHGCLLARSTLLATALPSDKVEL